MLFLEEKLTAANTVEKEYRKIIMEKYPQFKHSWPILAGYNILNGEYGQHIIVIFKDTGNPNIRSSGVISFDFSSLGIFSIDGSNIERVRQQVRAEHMLTKRDSVVILHNRVLNFDDELQKLLQYHEIIMGVIKMKIFLSHKSVDKGIVREVKKTLELLGFDPWLDEDSMVAGVSLERSIQQGFKDSCAAIFFVTPNFKDEDYLGSEVEYAISEKRKKKELFSIITLVLNEDTQKGVVPDLLTPYVYKEPKNEFQVIQEILKALPIQVGSPMYR